MGSTWQSLLDELVRVRDMDFRTEPERDQARRDTLEWIVQTILEKLRDEERQAGIDGRAAFASAIAQVDATKPPR